MATTSPICRRRGLLVGWDAVYGDWVRQAEKSLGGRAEAADVQVILGQGFGVTCCLTRGEISLPDGETVPSELRETSVFHKEDGAWKMIAHHADKITSWEAVVDGR